MLQERLLLHKLATTNIIIKLNLNEIFKNENSTISS